MKAFGIVILVLLVIVMLIVLSSTLHWCSRASQVVQQELDPQVLLDRYMWFKDASAQLDKKLADIKVYEVKLQSNKSLYGADAKAWPKDIRGEFSLSQSEVAGIKSSYNILAAQYNADMAKINYKYTNVGGLPKGATTVLPKEYKPYIEE